MRNIKLVDLKRQYKNIKPAINKAILKVISEQKFILGSNVLSFEKNFAKFCQHKYCLGLGSGSDALLVALKVLGLKPQDEVIVPVYTFIATAEAVTLLGGKVVFCDVDSQTGLIDVNQLEKLINKKTKFIIPVHLYGQMADMKTILKLAKKYQLSVIEDAAQAHGASHFGKKPPFANLATYSFFPAKNLGAFGDAGCIVTDNKTLFKKALRFRNHGRAPGEKYLHKQIGFNFRIDELQAAILDVKLKHLDKEISQKQKLAKEYKKLLSNIPQLTVLETAKDNLHSYHLFVVKTQKRDQLARFLKTKGIETGIHYPIPLHLQPAYKYLGYKKGDFPNAESLSKQVLSLPMFPYLSFKELKYIVSQIQQFFKR